MKYKMSFLICLLWMMACKKTDHQNMASGVLEADEIIISSEVNGKIDSCIEEGAEVKQGQTIVTIDTTSLYLQKLQLLASLKAISKKVTISKPQSAIIRKQKDSQQQAIEVQKEQMRVLEKERNRISNLVKKDAIPQKQLDDIEGSIAVLKQQILTSQAQLGTLDQQLESNSETVNQVNSGILSEREPLQVRIKQIDDQLAKCKVKTPIDGTILTKYMNIEEIAIIGKPILKVAKTKSLILRAYVTASQLAKIKLNQKVEVTTGYKDTKKYNGEITWISSKAEFTPKTIQTSEERENLVYAIKVLIPNDGYLKIGMYADIKI